MRRTLLAITALLALATSACQVHLMVPQGDAPFRYRDEVFSEVTVTTDLVYGSAQNQSGVVQDLRLDLYEPTGDTVTARPAIVWIHGGGFGGGNKTSPEIVDQATVFAKKGYVNVSISYRLAPGGCSFSGVTATCVEGIIDAREDAQAAVRWLRANAATYGIDADRIAAAGTSAGAITALNVGFNPENPGQSGNPGYPSDVRAAVSLAGVAILSTPNEGEAATLLFHGTADTVVPFEYAEDTVEAAEGAGLTSILVPWEGAGHVAYVQHRDEIIDGTTNFLYHTMTLGSAER